MKRRVLVWLIDAMLLLLALAAMPEARGAPPEVQIRLRPESSLPKVHAHFLCEVDDVKFMVPRRIVEQNVEFILKAHGVTLGLPHHRDLCRELTVWP